MYINLMASDRSVRQIDADKNSDKEKTTITLCMNMHI